MTTSDPIHPATAESRPPPRDPGLAAACFQLLNLLTRASEPGASLAAAPRTAQSLAERIAARFPDPADRRAFVERHLHLGPVIDKLEATLTEVRRVGQLVTAACPVCGECVRARCEMCAPPVHEPNVMPEIGGA